MNIEHHRTTIEQETSETRPEQGRTFETDEVLAQQLQQEQRVAQEEYDERIAVVREKLTQLGCTFEYQVTDSHLNIHQNSIGVYEYRDGMITTTMRREGYDDKLLTRDDEEKGYYSSVMKHDMLSHGAYAEILSQVGVNLSEQGNVMDEYLTGAIEYAWKSLNKLENTAQSNREDIYQSLLEEVQPSQGEYSRSRLKHNVTQLLLRMLHDKKFSHTDLQSLASKVASKKSRSQRSEINDDALLNMDGSKFSLQMDFTEDYLSEQNKAEYTSFVDAINHDLSFAKDMDL